MTKKIRLIACLACLALTPAAFADSTWTWSGGYTNPIGKLVTTTGTEAAPAIASAGISLGAVGGFSVRLDAAVAVTAGTLQAYLLSPVDATWARCPDLDIAVPAGVTSYVSAGFSVTAHAGRVAYVPAGLGQAVTIHIIGGP